ncbi:MAG TPA: hypothetical protein PK715_15685, partial [Chitinophagales bacterium]|nr:hypothetical protein [Chitinophagales bacterium]
MLSITSAIKKVKRFITGNFPKGVNNNGMGGKYTPLFCKLLSLIANIIVCCLWMELKRRVAFFFSQLVFGLNKQRQTIQALHKFEPDVTTFRQKFPPKNDTPNFLIRKSYGIFAVR